MRIKLSGLFFILIFYSCGRNSEKTKPILANITESVYASGIIKTKNQYEVFSTVAGTIDKIFVTENDLVKAGTPLISVSNEASKITRENALLAANYTDLSSNREKLTDLKNAIDLSQSKYRNDSAIYRRQQNLWSQNIGSKLELEQKELAVQNSQTALTSAKIKYNDLLRELKFTAEQSKNNLAISRRNEKDFTIKSDIEGKVYSLYKQPGEAVNPQVPIALIGDSNDFLLELQVDEYDIAKIRLAQKVLVSMDSYKGKVFEAKVCKIYPIMNEHTKSFSVEAIFVSHPPVLYPNLTVEANIVIQVKERALLVPRNFLLNDSFVLLGRDTRKKIITGMKDYQKVEIISGLDTNDVIYKPQ